jgi:hypothetical protein
LWIAYKIYYPSNYVHRDADGTDNNKFFRLWGTDYNDKEKVGATSENTSGGGSSVRFTWDTGTGQGPKGPSATLVDSSNKGRWTSIKIQVVAPTARKKGTLKMWKDGVLILNNENSVDNYNAASRHAYRYGYLLGWSNSGFSKDTYIYIDDVVFATKESDLVNLSPPRSLRIVK